jgi:tellurite resistance protein TehA-like permease
VVQDTFRFAAMDSRFQPAGDQSFESSSNNNNNNNFNPNFDRSDRSNFDPSHGRNLSGQTTRTNTWVQTPGGPYQDQSSNYQNFGPNQQNTGPNQQNFGSNQQNFGPNQQPGYFQGPVNVNGYPDDVKGNGYPEDVKGKDPFRDHTYVTERSVLPTPNESPRYSIDLEKEKAHQVAEPHDPHKKDPNQPWMAFGPRLKHFTWAWYTLTMATGGISTLIAVQPHRFPGLITVGAVFYIVNLFFFAILGACMVLRFTKFPGTFKESVAHEREGLFLGPFFLSIATIITGTQKYVVESYEANHPMRGWIVTSMAIAFWVYVFMTFCLATFQYSFLFARHTYLLTKFMPSWLLPIFPIMLGGTIAAVIAKDQPVSARMPIIAAGLGCQGLGFTMSIIMYAHYIGRLMQVGFPNREHRGAMFIGVGPPSFTALAFIGMANALPDDFDLQGDGLLDAHVLRTMAIVAALFLWVLAMWFFMIALIAVSLITLVNVIMY